MSEQSFPTADSEHRLLRRALAARFPFDPAYTEAVRHPSLRGRVRQFARMMPLVDGMPDGEFLAALQRDAEHYLDGKQVLHLEVVVDGPLGGYRALYLEGGGDVAD